MIVYRLSKEIYSKDLSGAGARKVGGRWNTKGYALLNTSQSIALATAEIAVHTPLGIIPKDYVLVSIEVPEDSIYETDVRSLPAEWRSFPHPVSLQKIGNSFLTEGKFLALKVPSAVVQGEFNYLINPSHKDFQKVKIRHIESFSFDERLS